MRQMLRDIQTGAYAETWIAENRNGLPWFTATRARERDHQIERVGARLRGMMPFLEPVQVPPPVGV
jgi:ketol-acid reductoisomerase